MIKVQTQLGVADNTGAQKVMCLQLLNSGAQEAVIGDIIVVVVKLCLIYNFILIINFINKVKNYFYPLLKKLKVNLIEAVPNFPIHKSDICRAVIVRTSKSLPRESGMSIRFDSNAVVLINNDGTPKGSMRLNFYF